MQDFEENLKNDPKLAQNCEDEEKKYTIAGDDYLGCKCAYSEKKVVEVIFKIKLIETIALNDKTRDESENSKDSHKSNNDWKKTILSDHLL